jgi:hypothetical protein
MVSSKRVLIDQAASGMKLALTLTGVHGEILLPQGTELTEAMIASLKRHQIDEINIEIAAENDQDAAISLARKIERLDHMFKMTENEQLNRELREYIIRYWTGEKT